MLARTLALVCLCTAPAARADCVEMLQGLARTEPSLLVVAGTPFLKLAGLTLSPAPDDGKVSVDSTKAEGKTAWLVVPVTHSFMMMNKVVVTQAMLFLRDGDFAADLNRGNALEFVAGGGT